MQFFKIQGTITNENWAEENDNKSQLHKNIRSIAKCCAELNETLQENSDAYVFISDASGTVLTAGMILRNPEDMQLLFKKFLKQIGIGVKDLSMEETTLKAMTRMLDEAERANYIENDHEVLEHYGLDDLVGHYPDIRFGENLIPIFSKEAVYKNAKSYLMKEDLLQELDRIYNGKEQKKIFGHPVHYMIQTDDVNIRKDVSRLLMEALYAKQRIQSRRYCFFNIESGSDITRHAFEQLYESCRMGTIVVRYMTKDIEDDECATGEMDAVIKLCEVMRRYRNQVLTIFCLPQECTKIRELIYEKLENASIVEVKDLPASKERSCDYLKMLAEESFIKTDKKLFAMLEDDKTYVSSELRNIFDSWYNQKLKNSVYPQYSGIATVKKKIAKAAPKGSAYDELMEMIGLEEPKKVIRQALDFFKAQKLFADKGMNAQRPSMHMVFTGNPGTAKTTVARLFARIMRENGLLSKGHLVEVGRSDLVGKFVGWTAKIVKNKFAEASGGVLFIDEAYSLADGKAGLFGEEAINTIVQEMENRRNELVVIFAGYPEEMERFIQSNPGLRSRIAFHVPFSDYNTEELCQIAKLQASKLNLRFSDEAVDKMACIFDLVQKESDFGNGRYVRNLIEKARMAQATRLVGGDVDNLSRKEIATITAEDIEVPKSTKPVKAGIGFRCA